MNTADLLQFPTYILGSILLAFLLSFPIISFLYRFKIIRHIEVDFSILIESRKDKFGTPIMGGLIIIVPTVIIGLVFNLSIDTAIPLIIFVVAALLGGLDDILNIYGKKRRKIPLRRIVKLIKVHKFLSVRIKHSLLFPWYVYKQIINTFESNPGKGLMGHEKFFIQMILGTVLGIWIYNIFGGVIWLPIIGSINISILIIPFAIFTLLSMTNAVNFSDGMDGLSAGMLISSYFGFLVIAIFENNLEIAILISTVIGSLITYLYFNIPPARVQMGDVGSFSLGALLAVVAFALDRVFLLPIIGFPFVVEVASSVLQSLARRIFGKRILRMAPLHHHFEMLGWSEEKVVMRFWLFSIVSVIIGLWLYFI